MPRQPTLHVDSKSTPANLNLELETTKSGLHSKSFPDSNFLKSSLNEPIIYFSGCKYSLQSSTKFLRILCNSKYETNQLVFIQEFAAALSVNTNKLAFLELIDILINDTIIHLLHQYLSESKLDTLKITNCRIDAKALAKMRECQWIKCQISNLVLDLEADDLNATLVLTNWIGQIHKIKHLCVCIYSHCENYCIDVVTGIGNIFPRQRKCLELFEINITVPTWRCLENHHLIADKIKHQPRLSKLSLKLNFREDRDIPYDVQACLTAKKLLNQNFHLTDVYIKICESITNIKVINN